MTQVLPPVRDPVYSVSEVRVAVSMARAFAVADTAVELFHDDMGRFYKKFGSVTQFAIRMFPDDLVAQSVFVSSFYERLKQTKVDIPAVQN